MVQLRGKGCVLNHKGPQDLFGHTVHFINNVWCNLLNKTYLGWINFLTQKNL